MQITIEEINKKRELLSKLELKIHAKLNGFVHGDFMSLISGQGTELGETRKYQPGDDVRRIDWNVTARLSDTHIRETRADRELTTWLLVDNSPRVKFGTAKYSKSDLSLAACASFGFLNSGSGNKLGALLIGGDNEEIIPPRGSRKHLQQILLRVIETRADDNTGETDIADGIKTAVSLCKTRSILVIVSDFLVKSNWQAELKSACMRHEVLAVQVCDRRDRELPNIGLAVLKDPATGKTVEVATHKQTVRDRFAEAATKRQTEIENTLRQCGAHHMMLSTERDWIDDVYAFIDLRKKAGNTSRRRIS